MIRYSKFLGQQPHGRRDGRSGCRGCGSNEVKLAKIGAYPKGWASFCIIREIYLQNVGDESVDAE